MEAEQRESMIRRWFEMWLLGRDLGIARLFSPDARYIESWGPAYQGVERIQHWFAEWNTRGKVAEWTILQFFHKPEETAVEWRFRAEMNDGTVQAFEGVSLVRWDGEGRICFCRNSAATPIPMTLMKKALCRSFAARRRCGSDPGVWKAMSLLRGQNRVP